MEKIPSSEHLPVNGAEVSRLLKDSGPENPEAKTLLNKWLDENQLKVESGVITNLEFNISWAELYRDAGMGEIAREAFEQAAELARQENKDNEYDRLQREIENLRDK